MTNSRLIVVVTLLLSQAAVARGDSVPDGPQEPGPATATWSPAVKLDWTLLFSRGFGASISGQTGRHEVVVMGFGTPLGPPFRDMYLSGAGEMTDVVNVGVEVGYSHFLRPDRRWLFVGALVSADRFRIGPSSLDALYVVPRVGVRVPLWRGFFVEPSIGVALRVASSEETDGVGVRRAAPVLLLPLGHDFR